MKEEWIRLIKDRNSASHSYDESESDETFERITEKHSYLLDELLEYFDN